MAIARMQNKQRKKTINMDKQLLKQNIENAFANFKIAIMQQEHINTKRADGGWSIGEIANHIIKSTGTDFGATQSTDRPYDEHAAAIKKLFLNFELKFPANETLHPDVKEYVSEEIFHSLDEHKEAVFEMIDQEDLTRLCTDIVLPVWGMLTKYEWLVLMENHLIRHTQQVQNFNNQTI